MMVEMECWGEQTYGVFEEILIEISKGVRNALHSILLFVYLFTDPA